MSVIRGQYARQSLPIILGMVAESTGLKFRIAGTSAFHNPATGEVQIPAGDFDDPNYVAATLGFTFHEGGHAKFTEARVPPPFDATTVVTDAQIHAWLRASEDNRKAWAKFQLVRWIWNALEDVRMEGRVCGLYPGAREYLHDTIVYARDTMQFFVVPTEQDPPLIWFKAAVLAGARFRVLSNPLEDSFRAGDKLMREHLPAAFVDELDAMVMEVRQAQSSQDVVELAERIYAHVEQMFQQQPEEPQQQPQQSEDQSEPQSGEGESTGDAGDQPPQSGDGESKDQPEQRGGDSSEQEGEGSESNPDSNSKSTGEGEDQSQQQGGASSQPDPSGQQSSQGGSGVSQDASQGEPQAGSGQQQSQGGGQAGEQSPKPKPTPRQVLESILEGETPEGAKDQKADVGDAVAKALSELAVDAQDDGRESVTDLAIEPKSSQDDGDPTAAGGQKGGKGVPAVKQRVKLDDVSHIARILGVRLARYLASVTDSCKRFVDTGGKVTAGRVVKLLQGNTKVFTVTDEGEGVDTALQLLLDRSGSMDKRIKLAREATAAVALACARVKTLSIGTAAFPPTVPGQPVEVLTRLNQSVAKTLHNYGVDADGGTPTTEALYWALQQLARLPHRRKLAWVVTDGEPNDPVSAARAVAHLRRMGVEVIGIGILTDARTMEDLFGKDQFTVVSEISKLPEAMFEVLRRQLMPLQQAA